MYVIFGHIDCLWNNLITSDDEDDADTGELDDLDAEDEGGLGNGILAIVRVVPRGKVGALLEHFAGHRERHDGHLPWGLKLWKVRKVGL